MKFLLTFLICSVAFIYSTNAQTTKKHKKETKKIHRSNSFEPFPGAEVEPMTKKSRKRNKKAEKKSFRYQFNKSLKSKKEEFYDRMEANAKRDRKAAREMEKPQYSDPSYFGHKHPPKKRKQGKRKFCKECGIVH